MKKELYNSFECKADRCTFTCCNGWEIILDSRECIDRIGVSDYTVACNEVCPFECDNGLCSIVNECGERGLPDTCRTFPRLINEYNNYVEYSLSFACPYVFDMAQMNENKLGCSDITDFDEKELYIRENIIHIIKNENRMDVALFTAWLYLTGNAYSKMEKNEAEYFQESALYEINNLFQDLTVNYIEVSKYKPVLIDIWDFSSENNISSLLLKWKEYKKYFKHWDKLLRHCIAEKVFFGCVNNDICDMIEELQVIITEYVMIRYSCFLNSVVNNCEETTYEDVRKYVTVFSRILGHNSNSVKEFFIDILGQNIWDTDYALMINF